MKILMTILISLLASEAIGYVVHRLAHLRSVRPLYWAHMTHHLVLYPPKKFLSDHYRSSSKDSFFVVFLPVFIVLSVAQMILLSTMIAAISIATAGAVGLVNEYLHRHYHIRGSWLERSRVFRRLRSFHLVHHRNMKANFGITMPIFDVVLGTARGGNMSAKSQ